MADVATQKRSPRTQIFSRPLALHSPRSLLGLRVQPQGAHPSSSCRAQMEHTVQASGVLGATWGTPSPGGCSEPHGGPPALGMLRATWGTPSPGDVQSHVGDPQPWGCSEPRGGPLALGMLRALWGIPSPGDAQSPVGKSLQVDVTQHPVRIPAYVSPPSPSKLPYSEVTARIPQEIP